jgi:hypothetical protein
LKPFPLVRIAKLRAFEVDPAKLETKTVHPAGADDIRPGRNTDLGQPFDKSRCADWPAGQHLVDDPLKGYPGRFLARACAHLNFGPRRFSFVGHHRQSVLVQLRAPGQREAVFLFERLCQPARFEMFVAS